MISTPARSVWFHPASAGERGDPSLLLMRLDTILLRQFGASAHGTRNAALASEWDLCLALGQVGAS